MKTFRLCSTARSMLLIGTFAAAYACDADDLQRKRALDDLPARHLIGQWDATLLLERPLTLAQPAAPIVRRVSGSITLLEDHYGRASYPQMTSPTHAGVYDLDLRSFGLPLRSGSEAPVVIAGTTRKTKSVQADSVHMVLNPGTSRYALLLGGRFAGDSIVGTWQAESFLDGGGSFVLHRHTPH